MQILPTKPFLDDNLPTALCELVGACAQVVDEGTDALVDTAKGQ